MADPIALVCASDPGRARVVLSTAAFDVDVRALDRALPAGAVAHVGYADGRALVHPLCELWLSSHLAGVVVHSPNGAGTVVDAVTAVTARVLAGDRKALAQHPAARVARYATGGRPEALAAVIARVFDPRWYVHPRRPDRLSRLEARFGLEPRFDGRPRAWRDALVACWAGGSDLRQVDANFYGRFDGRLLADRVHPHVAARRVGRHFLRSLTAAWLDALGPGRPEPMFDEKLLFDRRAVSAVCGNS